MKKSDKLKLSVVLLILATMLLTSCGTVYKGGFNKVSPNIYRTSDNDTVSVKGKLNNYLDKEGVYKAWIKNGKIKHLRAFKNKSKINKYKK